MEARSKAGGPEEDCLAPVLRLMGVLKQGLVAASKGLSGVLELSERGLVISARGASCTVL